MKHQRKKQIRVLALHHHSLFMLYILVVCATFSTFAQAEPIAIIQNWQCTIDLYQGDTGTLEFSRIGSAIKGETIVHRGHNTFTNKIKGEWLGEKVYFWRELSSSSGQPFKGVALSAEDNVVKMGGRFAYVYNGVWSADCKAGLAPPPLPIKPAGK